jgi:hypothetical protein
MLAPAGRVSEREDAMRMNRSASLESPLALDLLVGRATLVALKVEAKLSPTDAELVTVTRLCDHFSLVASKTKGSYGLPSDVIRDSAVRQSLETALAGIAHAAPQSRNEEPRLASRLAALLGILAKTRTLPRKRAKELVSDLLELSRRDSEPPRPAEVSAHGR